MSVGLAQVIPAVIIDISSFQHVILVSHGALRSLTASAALVVRLKSSSALLQVLHHVHSGRPE